MMVKECPDCGEKERIGEFVDMDTDEILSFVCEICGRLWKPRGRDD